MRFTDLPQECADCRTPLHPYLQPRRWQKKGVVILLAGSALTVALLGLLIYLLSTGVIEVPEEGQGLFQLFAIQFAPALLGAWVALRLPRTVRLSCRGCGWTEAFLIDNPRYSRRAFGE